MTPVTDVKVSRSLTLPGMLNIIGAMELVVGISVAMVLTSKTKPCDLSSCSAELARTSTAFAIIALSVFSTLLQFATATLLDEYRLIVRTTRSLAPTPAAG